MIAHALGVPPAARLRYAMGPEPDPLNARLGDPEPRPIFLGAARWDRPFQTQTEEGYAAVPDAFRQLVQRYGFKIRGAENIGELTPETPDVFANTEFDKGRINLSSQTPERNRSDIAHEIGHVFDRKGAWFPLSTDDPYSSSYFKEVANKPAALTYGGTNDEEGFAELFATALLTGLPIEDVYKQYPKLFPKSLAAVKANIDEFLKSNKELPR